MLLANFLAVMIGTCECGLAQPPTQASPLARKNVNLLLGEKDLSYAGAFRLPRGRHGASSFDYGATAMAFNPTTGSLLMVGHDNQQAIGEVDIPELKTGPIAQLNTATVRQEFVDVLSELTLGADPGESIKIGGLLVCGSQLIGSSYVYYDGNGNQRLSHFTLSSLDLSAADKSGLFQVGSMGGGWVGGWMVPVPEAWRRSLGATYLTGQGALSIISRTSHGPSMFDFDPMELASEPAIATLLLGYPEAHPLSRVDTQSDLFNGTTQIRGVVFAEGTDSLLFIGSHGTGLLTYGEGGAENGDPVRPYKGYHAYPYRYQVWAYDAHDLAAVKARQRLPWQVKPYAVWELDLPYPGGGCSIGGVAYDVGNDRIYISQQGIEEWGMPVIHVLDVKRRSKNSRNSPELKHNR